MARLQWKNLSPKNFGFPNYKGTMDSAAIGTWLTDPDGDNKNAMRYLKAVADKYGSDAVYNLLKYGDDEEAADNNEHIMAGISALVGDEAIDEIMSDINNPDLWKNKSRLQWKNLAPKSLGFTDGSDYFKGTMDSGVVGGWLTDTDEEYQHAMTYLKAIADKYGSDALYNLLKYGDDDEAANPDSIMTGISAIVGDEAIDEIMSDINNPDLWKKVDVNNDGDTDVNVADTNKNGKPDTAIVNADSRAEEKEAVKAAKEALGFDKNDKTSIGKTKGELEDDTSVVSDKKKKNMTCSDVTQKNILSALIDRRF